MHPQSKLRSMLDPVRVFGKVRWPKLPPFSGPDKKGGEDMATVKCCEKCGEPIQDGQPCFHVVHGYWEKDGFVPEEEVAYFCDECGVSVATANF